jgi:hypothetical protein
MKHFISQAIASLAQFFSHMRAVLSSLRSFFVLHILKKISDTFSSINQTFLDSDEVLAQYIKQFIARVAIYIHRLSP